MLMEIKALKEGQTEMMEKFNTLGQVDTSSGTDNAMAITEVTKCDTVVEFDEEERKLGDSKGYMRCKVQILII